MNLFIAVSAVHYMGIKSELMIAVSAARYIISKSAMQSNNCYVFPLQQVQYFSAEVHASFQHMLFMQPWADNHSMAKKGFPI